MWPSYVSYVISKIKRWRVWFCVFAFVCFVIYYVLVVFAETCTGNGSIPLELYSVSPRTDRPQPFSLQDISEEIPNLPSAYSNTSFHHDKYRFSKHCAPYPKLQELSIHNEYWQSLSPSKGVWYLFAVYYENRPKSDIKPAVRILVAGFHINKSAAMFCQMWFRGLRKPEIVKTKKPEKIPLFPSTGDFSRNHVTLYLITCPIPAKHTSQVPDSVSLVEKKCDTATNHLRVIYNKSEKKQDFAVCSTPLNFARLDISIRIAEWVELVSLLEAHKIFVYYHHHHENISKVLKYYEQEGKVQLHPFTLPSDRPNRPILQGRFLRTFGEYLNSQYVALHDCLYRNMYNYKYIAVLDVDEVIIPQVGSTWKDLFDSIPAYARENLTQFCAQNYWFHDDDTYTEQNYSEVPAYLHMLGHVHRTESYTVSRSRPFLYQLKCFRKPDTIKFDTQHSVKMCFGGCKQIYWFPPNKAKLQHYCNRNLRNRCRGKSSITDANIWRYKEALIGRVLPVLNTLGFLNS